jgi:hypothetical protein
VVTRYHTIRVTCDFPPPNNLSLLLFFLHSILLLTFSLLIQPRAGAAYFPPLSLFVQAVWLRASSSRLPVSHLNPSESMASALNSAPTANASGNANSGSHSGRSTLRPSNSTKGSDNRRQSGSPVDGGARYVQPFSSPVALNMRLPLSLAWS